MTEEMPPQMVQEKFITSFLIVHLLHKSVWLKWLNVLSEILCHLAAPCSIYFLAKSLGKILTVVFNGKD